MTRVITIPAREVVAGMLLHDRGEARVVLSVAPTEGAEHRLTILCRDALLDRMGIPYSLASLPDWDLAVTLLGPSPREMLCTCGWHSRRVVFAGKVQVAELPLQMHDIDCPVRRLRLRVWPAPVNGVPWAWGTIDVPENQRSGWVNDAARVFATPSLLISMLADEESPERASFCLPADPEVQP